VSFPQPVTNAHIIHLDNEQEIKRELTNLNTDDRAFNIITDRMLHRYVKLEGVDTRAANRIKKELSRIGGIAAISREAYEYTERTTDVILSGSIQTLQLLVSRIDVEEYGLASIARDITACLENNMGVMKVGKKTLDFRFHTYLIAQLHCMENGEPCHKQVYTLLKKVAEYNRCGVSIIDLSCARCDEIYRDTEIRKQFDQYTMPLIQAVKSEFPHMLVSIDTARHQVASMALDAGIDLVSELSPMRFNEQLITLIARKHCPVILLHNSDTESKSTGRIGSISTLIRNIQSSVSFAVGHGIDREKIIIDPGFGFTRHFKDNINSLKHLTSLKHLNLPLVIGMSKKTFFSETLDWKQVQMHISTISANILAIINGANLIRVNSIRQAQILADVLQSLGDENRVVQTD
jgi:dihydropteroate synthase